MGSRTELKAIKHVMQIMLENRSFDQMLGFLYAKSDKFDGLTGDEYNPDDAGRRVKVYQIAPNAKHPVLAGLAPQVRTLEDGARARAKALTASDPQRAAQGSYDHSPPDISSTAAIGDYIQGRSAAWTEHVTRTRKRQAKR